MAIKFKVIERGQPSVVGGGEENLEDVKSSSIRKAKVIFTPGGAIRDMLENLDYTKV